MSLALFFSLVIFCLLMVILCLCLVIMRLFWSVSSACGIFLVISLLLVGDFIYIFWSFLSLFGSCSYVCGHHVSMFDHHVSPFGYV